MAATIKNVKTASSQETRYFVKWDINISKLYAGCSKSKWDPDGSRHRRSSALRRKISKAIGSSDKHISGYKRHCDAEKLAIKISKIPEIKKVSIIEALVDIS